MSARAALLRLYWVLREQLGLDPVKALRSLLGLPRFLRDYFRFRSGYAGRLELLPCLHDWHAEGGATTLEYFWQDLLVARAIFEARPEKHVDVGSRVDGFVAHVASFREIEVFDVRPITTQVPGVRFRQADLMQPAGYCDSLSCLHALEHFGLGRYGDPVDPEGFARGLANMAALLKNDGVFYLSVPIGTERVEFNGQRVFDPRAMIDLALAHALELRELKVVRQGGRVETLAPDAQRLSDLASQRYALGIFTFAKRAKLQRG
jgi:SAM-dependent methyltransferase